MLQALRTGIPIRTTPRVLGPERAHEALLLVGHGSRCPVSSAEMSAVAGLVSAARPELAIDLGYLEMSDPPAGASLDRLVARGAQRIVVLPVMLLGAGHAKSDVPAVVLDGRQRHPGVELIYGAPMGVDHALVQIALDNVRAAGGEGLPLLVNARGTSDPDANADAHRATRLLAECTGAPWQVTGFSGVTTPLVPDALTMVERLGTERLVAFAWFLSYGKLVGRMQDDYRAFAARTGIEVVDAGWFGPDPRLAPILLDRYDDALAGRTTTPCDSCSYRLPYPGLEDRVGQAAGVGHSHLAHEHRHHQHTH